MDQHLLIDLETNCKFSQALREQHQSGRIPVISDIKCKSPGEGDLLQGRDPVKIADGLVKAGASVLSVVTEPDYFGGSTQLLKQIAGTVSVPILRKDFISNRDQLQETVDIGASAVLLIAAQLKPELLRRLVNEARELGLEPLVEAHNAAEVLAANELGLTIMGINNRDIIRLELDDGTVENTGRLARLVRPGVLVVSESSIASPDDVQRAKAAGAHAVLVGTAILKAPDPFAMFRHLSELGW